MNIWYLSETNDTEIIPENITHVILSKTYNRKFSLTKFPKTVIFLDLGWNFNYDTDFSLLFPNLKTLIISFEYMHDINISTLPSSLKTIIIGKRQTELHWYSVVSQTLNNTSSKFKTQIIINKKYKEKIEECNEKMWNGAMKEDGCIQYLYTEEYWMRKNITYTLVGTNNIPELLIKNTNEFLMECNNNENYSYQSESVQYGV